jgi:hypothetical protein
MQVEFDNGRIHYSILTLTIAFALGGSPAWGQTNLISNGSFETGPTGAGVFTDWDQVGPADNHSDFGVAKATSGYELAGQGTNFAYFRGHPTDSSQDCLGQTVNLKVGAIYAISYELGTDGPLTNGAAMWVVIGTSFGINLQDDVMLTAFFPNSATALPYAKFSTIYLATNATPILSFHGVNATNGLAVTNGILLDNVSISAVYPPLSARRGTLNSLTFTWPFTNGFAVNPYRLQVASALGASNWVTLTNAPATVGTDNQVAITVTNPAAFYRLTLP